MAYAVDIKLAVLPSEERWINGKVPSLMNKTRFTSHVCSCCVPLVHLDVSDLRHRSECLHRCSPSHVTLPLCLFRPQLIIIVAPGINTTQWTIAAAKADKFISQLNLTEKAGIVTGELTGTCLGYVAPIERLGFPGLCLADGLSAIHLADEASVFPAGLTAAATWDRNLLYKRGLALGAEFRGKDANIALG